MAVITKSKNTDPGKEQGNYLLSSVKNALSILQSFTMEEPEKQVTQLSRELGIGKSSVSRILATLASEGFVTKDVESQKYRLGLTFLSLSGVLTSQLQINKEARPILRDMVKNIGESVHLAVLEGTNTMYLEIVECNHPVRILTHLGKRNPAYCTSSGKVMLAFQSEGLVERIIKDGLLAYAPNTITSPDKLLFELKEINKQGYAISVEELLEGVTSIAAPIRDYTGKVVAAVSVIGPVQRIRRHHLPTYQKKVVQAANEISEQLGYWK
ncbi:IclR family transcriptional regulator [Peribacillus cavernae]|uniref:Glycerol operon regulatory protein n=1 Tax=Peribacillus cavernae TaxID=1674310 RepID=A0A433HWT5_9BACI|nr:IclR family transcriptional regulator [Peribacillus cavernae]MDQ0218036.1 DNA-binding IclR family transcriptional regulator [Peribacillus cavernae]RUQ32799.1 IclR family transcriptional regulator [Peribacillus cavernae]